MPKKVIIADDNSIWRGIYFRFVQDRVRDVEIDQVEDGKSLVEKVRNGGYSLVLTDNQMPNMNGFEAAQAIREFDKEVPIYMISGLPLDRKIYKKVLESGATGYINKDHFTEELSGVLKEHLES